MLTKLDHCFCVSFDAKTSFTVLAFQKDAKWCDLAPLINIVSVLLKDAASKLQVPLMEMLRYPYFLHHEQLAALFKMAMITLNQCGSPLKLEEKLPGAYLLLVHPDPEVWQSSHVLCQGLF